MVFVQLWMDFSLNYLMTVVWIILSRFGLYTLSLSCVFQLNFDLLNHSLPLGISICYLCKMWKTRFVEICIILDDA